MHRGQKLQGALDPFLQYLLGFCPMRCKVGWGCIISQATFYHQRATGWIALVFRLNIKSDPIKQLRAQQPLFWIHGADQHEMRWMCNRDGISLDTINSKRGSVKQQIYNMIIEQVDFIDVKEATISRCQQPWSVVADASCQGCCKVKTPCNAIFAGIEWKSNHVYGTLIDGERFVIFIASLTVDTHPLRGGWITEIRAVNYAGNRREQACKGTYSC